MGPSIPLPPDVAGQMPNMAQFAGQAQQAFQPPAGPAEMQGDPSQFATVALNDIADKLGKLAQVLLQTHPELAPLIQKMAEAGSMLQSQLTAPPPQETEVGSPTQATGPQDVPMA